MTPMETGPEGTKYVRLTIAAWYQESDKSIHITSHEGSQFHTTVKSDPTSKRHHVLYKHLKRVLQEAGRWPAEVE